MKTFFLNPNGKLFRTFALFFVSLLLLTGTNDVFAQVLIGNSTGTPHSSSMLEVQSTDKGLLIPRVDFANRPTGVQGLMYYQTNNTPGFYYYGSTGWKYLNFNSIEYWKPDGSNIYFTGGKVGIGTTTPGSDLEINSVISPSILLKSMAATGYGFASLFLDKAVTGSNNNAYIGYRTAGIDKWFAGTILGDDYSISQTYLTSDGTFFIRHSDRFVGINSTHPNAILEVGRNDANTTSQLWIEQAGTGDATIGFSIPSLTYSIGIDNSDANKFKIGTSSSVNSNPAMTITTDRKVGFGTTLPAARLHLENSIGTDQAYGLYINQNSSLATGHHYASYVNMNTASTGVSYGYYHNNTNASQASTAVGFRNHMDGGTGTRYGFENYITGDGTNTSIVYGIWSNVQGNATTGTSYAGYFYSPMADSQYALYGSGYNYFSNVSINTTTRKSGYELTVNGQVVCEELLVEDSGNWPDFVFETDYDLPHLKAIEKSIQENKHLPGIPSAQEIEENGILIGDMQKKLLLKIEELTLYLIDQNKEIELLKQEVQILKETSK